MSLPQKSATFIKSFVMLDLETSGLHQRTRITEIALVAALREHILDAKNSNTGLPRVLHKINLCVYPGRLIEPAAYEVSGLDNVLLQEQKPFDSDVFNVLESFLHRLPSPVCLIAHNGDRFDFPVLQAELKRINKVLPDVMCADSLKCFKKLFSSKNCKQNVRNESENSRVELESTLCQLNNADGTQLNSSSCNEQLGIYRLCEDVSLEDEFDGILYDLVEPLENKSNITDIVEGLAVLPNMNKDSAYTYGELLCESKNPIIPNVQEQNETVLGNIIYSDSDLEKSSGLEMQQQNETTPVRGMKNTVRKSKTIVVESIGGNGFVEDNKTSDCLNIRHTKKRTVQESANVRKRLNFSIPGGEVSGQPVSFKLTDLYQFLNDCQPENAHTADGDAINLLKCIVAVGSYFLDWADSNASQFCEVKPRN